MLGLYFTHNHRGSASHIFYRYVFAIVGCDKCIIFIDSKISR